jgi:hypothetical protein
VLPASLLLREREWSGAAALRATGSGNSLEPTASTPADRPTDRRQPHGTQVDLGRRQPAGGRRRLVGAGTGRAPSSAPTSTPACRAQTAGEARARVPLVRNTCHYSHRVNSNRWQTNREENAEDHVIICISISPSESMDACTRTIDTKLADVFLPAPAREGVSTATSAVLEGESPSPRLSALSRPWDELAKQKNIGLGAAQHSPGPPKGTQEDRNQLQNGE